MAIVLAMVLSACAGLLGDDAGGDVAWDDAPASLGVLTPGVDVADEPADVAGASYRTGEDGEPLVVSDLVRTDDAGFAEVRWVEGALARLDVDTVLEVTALDLETGQPTVSTRLEVGRVWNRLESDAATYEVETDVGTAAVRGTGFLVACLPLCTFGLGEGVLAIETILGVDLELRPGEQIRVDEDGQPSSVEAFTLDEPWLRDNLQRDEELGFAALDPTYDQAGGDRSDIARARLDGTYDFTYTVRESSRDSLVGQSEPRQYAFTPECATGPCGGTYVQLEGTESFVWTGAGFAATYVRRPNVNANLQCPDGSPRYLETSVLTFAPTAAEEVDGVLVVTAVDSESSILLVPTQEAVDSGCDEGQSISIVWSGSGTRTG